MVFVSVSEDKRDRDGGWVMADSVRHLFLQSFLLISQKVVTKLYLPYLNQINTIYRILKFTCRVQFFKYLMKPLLLKRSSRSLQEWKKFGFIILYTEHSIFQASGTHLHLLYFSKWTQFCRISWSMWIAVWKDTPPHTLLFTSQKNGTLTSHKTLWLASCFLINPVPVLQ